MAPMKVCLAMLLIFGALYRFLQSSEERDLHSMLQIAEWRAKVSSILSLTLQRQLCTMDKVNRKVATYWLESIHEHRVIVIKAQGCYISCTLNLIGTAFLLLE